MFHSSTSNPMSRSSRPSIPIYSGFQSPQKSDHARPSAIHTNTASSTSTVTVTNPPPSNSYPALSSPSRSTQVAFLRARSPLRSTREIHHEAISSAAATSTRFDSSGGLGRLPSMKVPSLLDEDEHDADADDEQTANESEVEQRWRQHHMAPPPALQPNNSTYSSRAASVSSSMPKSPLKTVFAHAAANSQQQHRAAASTSVASSASASPALSPSPSPTAIDHTMLPAVHAFLRSLYPNPATMPPIELTPESVTALYELQESLKSQDERDAIMKEELKEATREYTAEATRLNRKLGRLGLSVNSFSPAGQKNLAILVDLAQQLGLKNTDPASYIAALIDLRDTYHTSCDTLESIRTLRHDLVQQTHAEQAFLQQLRSIDAAMEEELKSRSVDLDQKKKQIPYFQVKTKEYEKETKELERELSSAGFTDAISHESILTLSDEISELNRQLEPLEQQIAAYQQLPPDITLARIRLVEARQELADLEDQFTRDIRAMHESEM